MSSSPKGPKVTFVNTTFRDVGTAVRARGDVTIESTGTKIIRALKGFDLAEQDDDKKKE